MTGKLYISLYVQFPDREDFIRELAKKKPDVKRKTLLNRYYDCRQEFGQSKKPKSILIDKKINKYNTDEKEKPSMYKMLNFNDIIKYKKPQTREYLMRYGFTPREINWLEDEGLLKDGMAPKAHIEED